MSVAAARAGMGESIPHAVCTPPLHFVTAVVTAVTAHSIHTADRSHSSVGSLLL